MNNSHQALWDDCLRLIKANVSEQQFKTWFAPLVFESYSEAENDLLVQVQVRISTSTWSSTTWDY